MGETTDAYEKVIAKLGDRHRVVECKDGIQWILQRRDKGTGQFPWRGVHYCRTKKALVRLSGGVDPAAADKLGHLPDTFQAMGVMR